jgi:hypothetical protein
VTNALAALPLVFLSLAAYAVEAEPPAESNLIGTVIFVAVFVGACAAVTWMIWKNDKKSKR